MGDSVGGGVKNWVSIFLVPIVADGDSKLNSSPRFTPQNVGSRPLPTFERNRVNYDSGL